MKLPSKSVFLVFVLPLAVQATAAAGLNDSVARCQAIEDRAARLQCFDELPGRATQGAASSVTETAKARQSTDQESQAARQNATVAPHEKATAQPDDFPRALEVTRISKTIDSRHIFYLSDGSAWQEFRNGSKRFRANRTATVEQSNVLGSSMFTSYWMNIDGAKFQVIPLK